MTISDIGEIRMCKRILKEETNKKGGIPFYKIGTFGSKADSFISDTTFEKYRSQYPYPLKGQVLISAAGTLGKTIAFDGHPSYFQDSNIVWIDNNESKVLNTYLLYALRYVNWDEYKTEGSVIPRIYNDNLRRVAIPVPSKSEQKEIVNQVKEYEVFISNAQAFLESCLSQKRDILQKYL